MAADKSTNANVSLQLHFFKAPLQKEHPHITLTYNKTKKNSETKTIRQD